MTRRVALYARVSTDQQSTDNQLQALRECAERAGWEIADEYVDHGLSGAKGRSERPQLDALMRAAAQRRVDIVAVWSVDRLGRSLQDLVGLLSELHALGIDLLLHQQGVDTTTPGGKALFQMLGVFAELERSLIRERVVAGLDRARAQGKQLGRPKVSPEQEDRVRTLLAAGKSQRQVTREVGCGFSVVARVKRELMSPGT